MSTTNLTAGDVMDRAAALMNDPARTDYTYTAQLPYLNMAIDELVESLEESNSSPTNQTSAVVTIPVGSYRITPAESLVTPHYPSDLVEIQEVGERVSGTTDPFIMLGRKEFMQSFPANSSLLFWTWENQIIRFNPNGALVEREVELKYIAKAIGLATDETTVLGTINARSFLSYKTAALCSQFIGENETRAALLEGKAEQALERLIGVNNKGRQQVMTRHRPFRASYKAWGGI